MLPPGHLAGGYLATLAVLRLFDVPVQGDTALLAFGMIASVAPDFDFLYAFAKTRSVTIDNARENHRRYYSHRPLVWFALSLPVILNTEGYVRLFGILLFVGTWTHFLLDSLQYGVMWLWPFSHKLYALRDIGKDLDIADRRFFIFWKCFLTRYISEFRLAAGCEVLLVVCALVVFMIERMR